MLTSNTSILIGIWLVIFNGLGGPGFVHEVNSVSTTSIGLETPYSIRIQTDEIVGLTQLVFQIPTGLSVSIIDDQNAQVTFGDKHISLLWSDLNTDEIFVNLTLSPETGFTAGEITPTITYIDNGDRVDVTLDKTSIEVFSNNNTLDQTSNGISCSRNITQEEDGVTRIDLTIEGKAFDGFLKITEHLPANCIVEISDNGNSIAEEKDGVLNFVWFDTKDEVPTQVSYKLLGCSTGSLHKLFGEIRYAFGNTEFSQDIADLTPNFLEGDVLLNNSQIADDSAPIVLNKTNTSKAMTPDNGVAYRVQLLAGHNDVSRNWISTRFNYNGSADSERHEGWVKYTTGSFPAYQLARNERENINNTHHFPQPFVTAYYLGERITVEEALVISQQDWIP